MPSARVARAMRSSFWQRLVSFPAMLVSILFVSSFFASLDVQQGGPVMRDPDLWWHLRNAQILLTTHHFIRHDIYSFTTFGQSWINPEWLAEIHYYLAFRAFAERGIFLVTLLAVDLIIAGVLLLCYRRSGHIAASWLAT
jgi:asparagine N-glycosylation enzyme membrane subunit Stt3